MGNRGRLERQELFGLGLSGRQRSGGKQKKVECPGVVRDGRGRARPDEKWGGGWGGQGGWMARGC